MSESETMDYKSEETVVYVNVRTSTLIAGKAGEQESREKGRIRSPTRSTAIWNKREAHLKITKTV